MTLLIRADGGERIGAGHVMRCLALGQAWQDAGGQVVFAMAAKAPALESRLIQERIEVMHLEVDPGGREDARRTARLAEERQADWLAVDGYLFGAGYQRFIKESGLHLLWIDDYGHAAPYCADLVLNQNIQARAEIYPSTEPYTRLLLGTQYALLRREFRKWRGWRRRHPEKAGKILITLGGSDSENVTEKVVQGLGWVRPEGLEATVVVGAANPHYQRLTEVSRDLKHNVRIVLNAMNMPELMAEADLAVSAGGSTCWELAFMGLPDITLILSEDQRPIAEKLGELAVAVNLGWHEDLSPRQIGQAVMDLSASVAARVAMSKRGQELVDGEGAFRVVRAMDA
jgi:UDP-2,4-diacetamido-2,4,6-trideoxy-beta-L-altropyranose hydrolase